MNNKKIKIFIMIICVLLFFTSCYLINMQLTEGSKVTSPVNNNKPTSPNNNDNKEKNKDSDKDVNIKKVYKINWIELNLRTGPSLDYKIETEIPKGTKIEILSKDSDWSKVKYEEYVGYVNNYYLSDDGKIPEKEIKKPTDNSISINYDKFNVNMVEFVNDNKINSPTNYLLTTSTKNKYTYVFVQEDGSWKLLYKWSCTVGKSSTPTIKGTFFINGRKPYFGTNDYRVKHATRIKGGYYYHSILFESKGNYIIDPRLGMELSHGCIRLDTENAEWIYNNISDQTKVIIK